MVQGVLAIALAGWMAGTSVASEGGMPLSESRWPGLLATDEIGLADYVDRVLQRNESLQVRLLELEVSRLRNRGERAVFQPEFVGSYEHVDSLRPNTSEQERQQFTSFYEQQDNLYSMAMESLVPTGARVRLGFNLSDLENNLQGGLFSGGNTNGGEYLSFVGVNLVQPLLRNGGVAVTMAGIRLAAVASDVAYQEYRRQVMQVVSRAESFYWQLYFAQEQLRFFDESVAVAENLLNNNRARLRLGNASELDVLEAEAGLALRRSKQAEARQKLVEISNSLIGLCSSTVIETNLLLRATDHPEVRKLELGMYPAWRDAIALNPDYLAQRRRIAGEMIRKAYARNQRLPQLNLKTSVGYYGLSDSPHDSLDDLQTGDWPAWTLGAELRVPMGAGSKARYEYDQALIRQKQAELQLQDLETQIVNALDTAMRNVASTIQNVGNYRKVAEFYQNLFETQQRRLDLGAIDSQKLLETEEKLFEAKNTVVESLVLHERARLELELVKGTLLQARNLDLSKSDLERRTAAVLTKNLLPEDRYDYFLQELKAEFDRHDPDYSPNTPVQTEAIEVLRKTLVEMDAPPAESYPADHADPAVLQKALDTLHEEMQRLQRNPRK
ncbi:MAG: TolC family protein [Verrucomicrobia bacterium]|nr:TolC family protein [Verrucomicrobiota bacterium]